MMDSGSGGPRIDPTDETTPAKPAAVISLEAVEVELALSLQDIIADGFEGALKKTAAIVGGEVLFNMPAPADHHAQRIGAIAVPNGEIDQVVFVMFERDGATLTVSTPEGDNAYLESLGQNLAVVMRVLQK